MASLQYATQADNYLVTEVPTNTLFVLTASVAELSRLIHSLSLSLYTLLASNKQS
jgi:hypothetical protein